MTSITSNVLACVRAMSAYRLAGMADAQAPDSPISPGAEFLTDVRDAIVDLVEASEDDAETIDQDAVYAAVDAAVPIYTHTIWTTYVDLQAYQIDPADIGFENVMDVASIERLATASIAYIGEQLADSIIQEIEEAHRNAE